ncbi:DUF6624 domain-containing protein [Tenacibaculum sp. SG-28]|uniref:DUF6624 domain-containing protein n=1 Tax=Tenacibaculum sp. SG-28 TaxID=754426 RepID=UPI000CF381F7|nr:DUF6624 domain-containing protein [Tenacibaculum sp. SG-28]PQJ21721.1 hypothetical protein BSU00_06470 [Tenacibaculum sp. SG-28]
MKIIVFLLTIKLLLITDANYAQQQNYTDLIRNGWGFCLKKEYTKAIKLYEAAFKLEKPIPIADRYNLSCIYALSGNSDKAFYQLFNISSDSHWDDYTHLINDTDLHSLHGDSRWEDLKLLVLENKKNTEKHFDKALVSILDTIYYDDQSTRSKIRSMEKKFGRNSKEMDQFWQTILQKDSINLTKVRAILEERGWPSKKTIGKRGTSAIFLVLQHANLEVQEKYLVFIKEAVANNDLPKRQYAMFYDRLLLRRGQRQIYGTQLARSSKSNKPYVLPLEDPLNVDKRRLEMGLNSMQENLNRWNLIWEAKTYLKELPQIEARERELRRQKS